MLDIDEPKKKRVNKACDSCRMKKTKCDGLKPCSKCIQDNKLCTYSEKRKQAEKTYSSDYVELLESRIDILQSSLQKLVVKIAKREDVKRFVPEKPDILSINKVIELLQADGKSEMKGKFASRRANKKGFSGKPSSAAASRHSVSSFDTLSVDSEEDLEDPDNLDDLDGSDQYDYRLDAVSETEVQPTEVGGDNELDKSYFSPNLKYNMDLAVDVSDARNSFGHLSPDSVVESPSVHPSNSGPSVLDDDLRLDLGVYSSGAALAAAALKGHFLSGLSNAEDSGLESAKEDPLASPIPWGTVSPAALDNNSPACATPAASINSIESASFQTSLPAMHHVSGSVNHLSKVHKAGGATQTSHHYHSNSHSHNHTHSPATLATTLTASAAIPVTTSNNPYYIKDVRSRRRDRSLSKASVNRLPRNRSVDETTSPTSSLASSVAQSPKTGEHGQQSSSALANAATINSAYVSSGLRNRHDSRNGAFGSATALKPTGQSGQSGTSISSVNTDTSSSVSHSSPRSSISLTSDEQPDPFGSFFPPGPLDVDDEVGASLFFSKQFVQMEDLQTAADKVWLTNNN